MSPRFRRTRIVVASLLGVVAAYGVVGAFVVPPVARGMIETRLGERLGRHVTLDKLAIAPYSLQAQAKGLRVYERDGRNVFASFDSLDLDADIVSLYHRAPVLDELKLGGLRVHVVREDATRYNFSDILERLEAAARAHPAKNPEEPMRFSASGVRVVDSSIDFDDRVQHATHRVGDVRLAIPSISNLPTHVKDRVQPSFAATIDGSPVELTGEALPFEKTVSTRFNIDVHALDLKRYLGYLPADLPARAESGVLDAKMALRFSQAPGAQPAIDLAGTASVRDVAVATPDGPLARFASLAVDLESLDPLGGRARVRSITLQDAQALEGAWKLPSAQAQGLALDLKSRTVHVASVATAKGALAITRNADGTVTMPRVKTDPSSPKWNVAVDSVAVTDYTFDVRDATTKPEVRQKVVVAELQARDLRTENGFQGATRASLRVGSGGTVEVDTTFALEPLQVDAKIDARSIDTVPLRAYMNYFPGVQLKSALASAAGRVKLASVDGATRISYDGTAEMARFDAWDSINREDLLNWKRIKASGVKLELAPRSPLRLAVADIDVDSAYSRIIVTPEGKLNVQQLMRETPANAQPAETPGPPAAASRDIRIDRIRFADSRLNFTDHYIRPNYTADVKGVHGSVTQLSSDPATRASVVLQGSWDGSSPVLIAGRVNPLAGDLFLDVAAKGEAIDLTHLTAYSRRYAGYEIDGGTLTLDVKYHVEGGKMEGRNRILVDHLALGKKVEGPDATSLPVAFIVSLLQDKDGRINLMLPISGSLDDPKFDIGAVIGQMFSSRMAKAESSPFSMLAAADGEDSASGDDLAYVQFAPGSADLTDESRAKLDRLAKLLTDRPGLKLALNTGDVGREDLEALKAAALKRRMDEAPKDLSKEAREKLAQQPVEVTDEQKTALLQGRVEQVKAYLTAESRLPAERVVLAAQATGQKARPPAPQRVVFALR